MECPQAEPSPTRFGKMVVVGKHFTFLLLVVERLKSQSTQLLTLRHVFFSPNPRSTKERPQPPPPPAGFEASPERASAGAGFWPHQGTCCPGHAFEAADGASAPPGSCPLSSPRSRRPQKENFPAVAGVWAFGKASLVVNTKPDVQPQVSSLMAVEMAMSQNLCRTILERMNTHVPPILMFTIGTGF